MTTDGPGDDELDAMITRLGDAQQIANGFDQIGRLLARRGDMASAGRHLQKAGAAWDRVGNPESAAAAYLDAAKAFAALGMLADALPPLREAARRLRSMSSNRWLEMSDAVTDGLRQAADWEGLEAWVVEIAPSLRSEGGRAARVRVRSHVLAAFACLQLEAWAPLLDHVTGTLEEARSVALDSAVQLMFMASYAHRHRRELNAAIAAAREGRSLVMAADLRDAGELTVVGLGDLRDEAPEAAVQELALLEPWLRKAGLGRTAAHAAIYRALAQSQIRPVDIAATAGQLIGAANEAEPHGLVAEAGRALLVAGTLLAPATYQSSDLRAMAIDSGIRASQLLQSLSDSFGAGVAAGHVALAMRPMSLGPEDDRDPRLQVWQLRAGTLFRRAGHHYEAAGEWAGAAMSWRSKDSPRRLLRLARLALATYELSRRDADTAVRRHVERERLGPGLLSLPDKLIDAWEAGASDVDILPLLWACEEAFKGRAFVDGLATSRSTDSQVREDSAQARRVEILEYRWRWLEESLERLLRSSRDDKRVEALMGERDEAKLVHAEAQLAESRRRQPAQGRLPVGNALSVDEFVPLLAGDEAYVGLLVPIMGSRLLVCTVTARQGLVVRVEERPRDDLRRTAIAHLDVCETADPDHDDVAHRISAQLWRLLFGTLPAETRSVAVSPHAQFGGYPFALAARRHAPDLSVSLVPSATTLARLRQRRPIDRDLEYLGIASNADGRLLHAAYEITSVAGRFFDDGMVAVLPSATPEAVLARSDRVGLLHLACHADRTGLLLGSADDLLTPPELADLSLEADIILLTGCHAGVLTFDDASEFTGVVRELLISTGARAVVASRAPVPDAAGPIFSTLLVAALTGRDAGPFSAPSRPLPVAEAVAWASERMHATADRTTMALIGPPVMSVHPSSPAWWSPWLTVGDPMARL